VFVEARAIERQRLTREQRAMAAPAIGVARQLIGPHAVGGVAVGADDVKRFSGAHGCAFLREWQRATAAQRRDFKIRGPQITRTDLPSIG